jgi:hypothetical protein
MTRQHLRLATSVLLLTSAASCAPHRAAASTRADAPAAPEPAGAKATKAPSTAPAGEAMHLWHTAKTGEEYDLKVVAAEMT